MSIEEIRELEALASVCPELNMANYTEDDVRQLNDWAIEMSLLVEKVIATAIQQVPMTDEQISLEAHNADDRDWNDLRFRSSWHEGFLEGARFAEARHGITTQAKKETL